ncbi:unnamed protein product, partial [Protopolystoma xenopodis]
FCAIVLSQVRNDDHPKLTSLCHSIIKDHQPFERLEIKKADLLEMFAYNQFKLRILKERVNTPTTTVYRCGPLIDLCLGPHALEVIKSSAAYWEGKADAESLQRIYGISFPDIKQLKEWKRIQVRAVSLS